MISGQEENRIKWIAMALSALLFGGIVLLLILWMIHVPNPPQIGEVTLAGGGGGGGGRQEVEVTLAPSNSEWDNYKFPEAVNETPVTNTEVNNDVMISDVNGVDINQPKSDKNTNTNPKNNNTNTPKENSNIKNWQDQLSNANTNNTSTSTTGGATTGSTTGDGPGSGPDFGTTSGPGSSGTGGTGSTKGKGPGFGTGRSALVMPCRPNVTKREGKVVVIIKVDRNGNVIDADPNGPGTDTSDPELITQARQAAYCAKFEACTDCPATTKGTIIFDFGYSNK